MTHRNSQARLTLPCLELLIPDIPGVGGHASFSGPFTRGNARAGQHNDSDDDNDYVGTSNAMHTSRSRGRRRSRAHSA